ncbi:MAG: SDR family NAD(P)-dependent oxidoreductase [Armatimonadetes bacterium]|nr:SDR family NAD(P)-dependent oxidoreductase [Armatimonadota bacterium]
MSESSPKRALITGASSGIGRATAELFALKGVEVGILAEIPEQVEEAVRSINDLGGRAFPVHADLSRPEDVEDRIHQVEAEHGPVDVLVNNAGIGLQGEIVESRPEDLRLLFEVNFFAMATLSREAFGLMAKRGGGHIINVSSASAKRALPGLGIYAATKAAMHAFSQALRIEGKSVGVHVTEILPMSVRTPFFDNARNRSERPYEISSFSTTPEVVAEKIYRAVRHPAPEVYTSTLSRIALGLDSLFPKLMDTILARRHRKT